MELIEIHKNHVDVHIGVMRYYITVWIFYVAYISGFC